MKPTTPHNLWSSPAPTGTLDDLLGATVIESLRRLRLTPEVLAAVRAAARRRVRGFSGPSEDAEQHDVDRDE